MNRTPSRSKTKPAAGFQCKNEAAILGKRLRLPSILIASLASVALAQSPATKKGIPTIVKTARSAIVTIVMANDDKPIALGSGFLVRPDGLILTNYHVIATGNVAVVKFPDGSVTPVDGVFATDRSRDLAVIKIHGKSFPTLTLGNSDQAEVGEGVVAIGNPLGLELTVSNGILSGIREDEKEDAKLLQITAPISPGSSGGPLFNMEGQVIGITTLYVLGGEDLNFAIPVNEAKDLLQSQTVRLQQLPNERTGAPTETAASSATLAPSPGTPSSNWAPSHQIIFPFNAARRADSQRCRELGRENRIRKFPALQKRGLIA